MVYFRRPMTVCGWSQKLCKNDSFACTKVDSYISFWTCVTIYVHFLRILLKYTHSYIPTRSYAWWMVIWKKNRTREICGREFVCPCIKSLLVSFRPLCYYYYILFLLKENMWAENSRVLAINCCLSRFRLLSFPFFVFAQERCGWECTCPCNELLLVAF